jgi:hypothetical protein
MNYLEKEKRFSKMGILPQKLEEGYAWDRSESNGVLYSIGYARLRGNYRPSRT